MKTIMQRTAVLMIPCLLCAVAIGTKAAVFESYTFASVDDNRRYQQWIEQLRCLVCQNQNIAESNADLAVDLRRQTKHMIDNGDSDAQIEAYMVERYGDFILYSPPLRWDTAVLWWGPIVFVIAGLGLLAWSQRPKAPK